MKKKKAFHYSHGKNKISTSEEKTQLHQKLVNENLEGNINKIIQNSSFFELENNRENTLKNRQKQEETLNSIKFDNDIDLNREKTREQRGFKFSDKGEKTNSERFDHISDVEQTKNSRYGQVEMTSNDVVENFKPFKTNSERFDHINDVEQTKNSRYGQAEKTSNDINYSCGAIGQAKITGNVNPFIINNRNIFTTTISKSASEFIKKDLKNKSSGNNIKNPVKIFGREIENAVCHNSRDNGDDFTEKTSIIGKKYGYKKGKYIIKGGIALSGNAIALSKKSKNLASGVATGIITGKTAAISLTNHARETVISSSSKISNIFKTELRDVIDNFDANDDFTVEAITKPKDVVLSINRTLTLSKGIKSTFKNSIKLTKKTINSAKYSLKMITSFGKKTLSNPLVIKGAAIIALASVVISLIISVVSTVIGMFPVLSLKSEDYEISQTYLYITELDARMEDDIINEDTRFHIPEIDEYHYYLNGVEISKNDAEIYTNADLVLAYLDAKYEDYSFNGVIEGFFGTTAKEEIDAIHQQLHEVEKTRRVETITHEYNTIDPYTGQTITVTWDETIEHMDIEVTSMSWENYYQNNKDILLTDNEQQQYETQLSVGVYTFRKELASPFIGNNWLQGVSSRWGWRIHPISGELKQHLGLDIAMPGGKPINACNSGIIETHSSSYGLGNHIKVIMPNGDYTLYGHMSGFAVSNGDQINAGDVIGYVGTTGTSTGNHLHLEYHKSGQNLNPLIFTECDIQE